MCVIRNETLTQFILNENDQFILNENDQHFTTIYHYSTHVWKNVLCQEAIWVE